MCYCWAVARIVLFARLEASKHVIHFMQPVIAVNSENRFGVVTIFVVMRVHDLRVGPLSKEF